MGQAIFYTNKKTRDYSSSLSRIDGTDPKWKKYYGADGTTICNVANIWIIAANYFAKKLGCDDRIGYGIATKLLEEFSTNRGTHDQRKTFRHEFCLERLLVNNKNKLAGGFLAQYLLKKGPFVILFNNRLMLNKYSILIMGCNHKKKVLYCLDPLKLSDRSNGVKRITDRQLLSYIDPDKSVSLLNLKGDISKYKSSVKVNILTLLTQACDLKIILNISSEYNEPPEIKSLITKYI